MFAEVTEVTPPRVTARRRWQRPEAGHSPEETVVGKQSRQPPPITPRKSLSISLRSETETVLVGLREEGIPCVPSADELEDIDKDDEREREDKVGSRPSSTKDEEANEENVDMRRKIEQERLPSAEQLHQEQTSPFSSTSSSSTVTPSSSPLHSPDPVPCSLTPEPVTPPRPQPIERQFLAPADHQRSPVPTPRLSRGDLRLSRSNRPALRRLQLMRRTLEREHDALSSALARAETAITGRPNPEIHPSQDTSDLKIGFRWDRPQTERPEMRLDSPQLDDLAKRNRDRQRRLEERKKAGQ
ncbi:hypothetical protein FJT64_013313 [Amphibalanus amphitrite]|uniref:Uncharacterized protein n=1 Tax=Amphibalanus amphitrite TaxID=1232801 RepID=A0A6A4V0T4_AMPAM|nr:hypothetical protein FJT64_013313 [Amphibalanus amphitrite]KAF0288327.1 hypothetical protein FJT64_013313 [Amphibalanus amphitrite]KAF0288328.1 hypothetical protein FJT64_013313 [Amphibalanus amphitrite]